MREVRRVFCPARVDTNGSGCGCVEESVRVPWPPTCLRPEKGVEDENNRGEDENNDQKGFKRRRNDVGELVRKNG